ncbi:MAG: hypothetical protein SFY66_25050 [Oculatellaceae cyanobacterium bins.114]|nr:hypothetical protein [Oculatellaceae cyanobacterium bins.114]
MAIPNGVRLSQPAYFTTDLGLLYLIYIALVRKLKAKAMAQILILGKLSDSPPPHRMWLRL